MTTYVYKSTTGSPVNVEDYVVTVNPGLQSTEQIEALDAFIGTSIARYDDGVLVTTDNSVPLTGTIDAVGNLSGIRSPNGSTKLGIHNATDRYGYRGTKDALWQAVRYLDATTTLTTSEVAANLTETEICKAITYIYSDGWSNNTHSPKFIFGGSSTLVEQNAQDPNYGHPHIGQIQMWDAVAATLVNKNPSGITGSTSQFLDNNGAGANILLNASHTDATLPAGNQNVWRVRYLAPTSPITSSNRRCVFRTQGLGLRRTYKVDYSFKFDTGWPVTNDANNDALIWQVKSSPRTGQYGHPSLSLYVTHNGTNPMLQLACNYPHHRTADWSKSVGNGKYVRWLGTGQYYAQPISSYALPVGVYHDLVIEFFLDDRPQHLGGQGYCKVWLGAELLFDVKGPTAHPECMSLAEDVSSHSMQFGIYAYNHTSGAQDKSILIERANVYWDTNETNSIELL